MVTLEDCEVKHDSGKALLVYIPDYDDDVWIPKSVIEDESECYAAGHEGALVIKDWFAQKEGLES